MDFSNVSIAATHFKDLRGPPFDNKHIFADIVILDKTDPGAAHPFVYQMKQTTASTVQTMSLMDMEWLKTQNDPFVLLGEMLSIDPNKKIIQLLNEQTISFQYLIVIAGEKGAFISSYVTVEFSAGVQTLIEALKIRRQGIVPQAPSNLKIKDRKANRVSKGKKGNIESVAQKQMSSVEQEIFPDSNPSDTKFRYQICV